MLVFSLHSSERLTSVCKFFLYCRSRYLDSHLKDLVDAQRSKGDDGGE